MTRGTLKGLAILVVGLVVGGAFVALVVRPGASGGGASSATGVQAPAEGGVDAEEASGTPTPNDTLGSPEPPGTTGPAEEGTDVPSMSPRPSASIADPASEPEQTEGRDQRGSSPGGGSDRDGRQSTSPSPAGGPGAPPPTPRPTPSAPPRNVDCQIALLPGPSPVTDDIRLVINADAAVRMLWAIVEQDGRQISGAIPLAGGRGEQVINDFDQGAKVTVYADASLDPATISCRAPAE